MSAEDPGQAPDEDADLRTRIAFMAHAKILADSLLNLAILMNARPQFGRSVTIEGRTGIQCAIIAFESRAEALADFARDHVA